MATATRNTSRGQGGAKKSAPGGAKKAPRKSPPAAQKKSLKNEVIGVLLIAVGLVFCLGIFSFSDAPFTEVLHGLVFGLFGAPGYVVGFLIIISGVLVIAAKKATIRVSKLMLTLLVVVCLFSIVHLFSADKLDVQRGFFDYIGQSYSLGVDFVSGAGAVGAIFTYLFLLFFGNVASLILFFALLLCAVMVLTNLSLKKTAKSVAQKTQETVGDIRIVRERRREEKQQQRNLYVEDLHEVDDRADEIYTIDEDFDREELEQISKTAKVREYELPPLPNYVIQKQVQEATDGDVPPWDVEENFIEQTSVLDSGFEQNYSDVQGDALETYDIPDAQAFESMTFESSVFDAPPWDQQGQAQEKNDFVEDVKEAEFDGDIRFDGAGMGFEEPEYDDISGFNKPDPLSHKISHTPDVAQGIEHFAPIEEEEDKKPSFRDEEEETHLFTGYDGIYHYPSPNLLEINTSRAGKNAMDEMRINADLLESTLASFGVKAKVMNVARGPVVTRYELTPALGVKVSKIVSLTDDIALNMAAKGIRIEAPIPGKSAIGVEIPNSKTTMVRIRDLVDSEDFRELKSPISFSVGKDLTGKNIFADIAKMPHLLVAGATGSGKSVCINSIIISIIYHASPDDVQIIMIDPKMVELSSYNDIPHLRIPVVTDPKKAAGALNWAVVEMTARYKAFAKRGVRNIEGFNAQAEKTNDPKYPKLLVIVDELADLMMTASKEVEDSICRIAQLGRASGIHLIIATQRPSVNVITGTIKANIPSRIAFAVSSPIDSRTILDTAGADRLLGQGDMLYYPAGTAKPVRIQGCFVSDDEVERVTDFVKSKSAPSYDEECVMAVESSSGGEKSGALDGGDLDPLIIKALEIAVEYEQVSASMLQRKIKVGYARAARILDEMEELGYIGPSEGAKPRVVMITRDKLEEIKGGIDE